MASRRGWATVTVGDDGPGVPDAERELIFERFQRGSATGGGPASASAWPSGASWPSAWAARWTRATGESGPAHRPRRRLAGARFTLRLPIAEIASENGA